MIDAKKITRPAFAAPDQGRMPLAGRLARLGAGAWATWAAITAIGAPSAWADPAAAQTHPPAVTTGRVGGSVNHGGTSVGPNGEPLGDLTLILQWAMWLGDLVCLVAFIIAAGRIGIAIRHGDAVDGLKGAGLTCLAAIVIGASLRLASTLLS